MVLHLPLEVGLSRLSSFCAAGVIVLTAVVNPFRLYKLDRVEKFVMSYGGLRGAVAFALVLLINPKHVKLQPMFVTTTIAVIYFTVFFQVRGRLLTLHQTSLLLQDQLFYETFCHRVSPSNRW